MILHYLQISIPKSLFTTKERCDLYYLRDVQNNMIPTNRLIKYNALMDNL
jgi:hypothetical protein